MAGTCAKPLLPTWWLIAIGWLVIVILVGGTGPFQGKGWPEIHGDDAWRLVEVQNLVAGQAWTDTTQYRDNTPYGSPMHWSRLIDAPLAVLTVALSPIYGHEAVLAAASLWPFVVLAAFLTLIVVLAERLAGPRARLPALMVTLLAFSTYAQFMGGRVDHHNVQMVIVLALMLATVVGRTSIPIAGLAGVVAATGIAVGTECLPAVLAALALFPLFWVMDPVAGRGPAVSFSAAFGLALLGHLLLVTNPAALLAAACDALSVTYVAAGLSYAAAVLVVTLAGSKLASPWLRFGFMGAAGVVVLAVILMLFPECRAGPYAALDELLARAVLTDFGEAMPIWRWIPRATTGAAAGSVVLPLAGLAGAVIAAWVSRGEKRLDWLVIAAFSIMLVVVMVVQVRGLRLAVVPAFVVGGWVIASLWKLFRRRSALPTFAALIAGSLPFINGAHVLGIYFISPDARAEPPPAVSAYEDCLAPGSFDRLAALPKGRVVSYLFMGPTLLLQTPHSIVSAGYHRGEEGLRDALAFVASDAATAQRIARERELDYFVFCRGVPLNSGLHDLPEFQGITAAGVQWPWLRPISTPDEAVQIYAIDLPG
jgi:hypothetical protein